jgi:hypothetical protein
MNLGVYSQDFSFPPAREPEWAPLVERWYQLDAAAYGVTEVYWRHRDRLQKPPSWILLCSPGASNATDRAFAHAAQPSPAKFVHTLPNIRSAALLQAMKWAGPVLCVQNDPNSILTGLREGLDLDGPVWVVSVSGQSAHIFVLSEDGELKIRKCEEGNMANAASHDKQWLSWISKPEKKPFAGMGLLIG